MKFLLTINDHFPANIFLFSILAYIGLQGYRLIFSNQQPEINLLFLLMLVPVFMTDGIKTLIESLHPKTFITGTEDLSKVTVIIPTFNGAGVIEETINNLARRFPKNQIIISSNGSTDATCDLVEQAGVKLFKINENVGKVEAINRALSIVETPYVLIMDDDTLIGDALIPTSELDRGLGGVAFRVLPIKKGFFSLMQLHEYRKSMDVGRRFHNKTATVQNISGAIGLFKTTELERQTKIHNGEFSGEDLQRTLLVHLSRKTSGGVIMADSIVETLVPDSFQTLFRQRVYGWYPGFLSNFSKYFNLMFHENIPFRLRFEAFYNCIILAVLDPLRLISLPILLFSPIYLLFFYIVYLIIELVPYLVMGRKDPLWIIFLFPIYGIINFIARMLAMTVFFYRLTCAKLSGADFADSFKKAESHIRWKASISSVSASIFIVLFYYLVTSAVTAAATNFNLRDSQTSNEPLISPLANANKKPLAISNTTPATTSKTGLFQHQTKKGDSLWSSYKSMLDQYKQENPQVEFNQMIATQLLVNSTEPERVYSNLTLTLSNATIENAIEASKTISTNYP